MSADRAAYPFRPDRKNRPKSTHRASKKSKTWHDGGTYKFPVDEKMKSFLRPALCSSSMDNNPAFDTWNRRVRTSDCYVHEWNKKGRIRLPLV